MKKLLEKINVFMIAVAIFIFIIGFCVLMLFLYKSPVDLGSEKETVNIEVKLPVLEWNKYEQLSKKINISANPKVKRRVADKVPAADELNPR